MENSLNVCAPQAVAAGNHQAQGHGEQHGAQRAQDSKRGEDTDLSVQQVLTGQGLIEELEQAIKANALQPKQNRRTGRALYTQIKAATNGW